ncbi:MAG: hypothetical protein K0S45_188 [Nitrospira sp.]|jgi:hypothetical protein|nr:hypothetical protein [Nitrospira sp.]
MDGKRRARPILKGLLEASKIAPCVSPCPDRIFFSLGYSPVTRCGEKRKDFATAGGFQSL